jgi:acyl-CoA hydrolase/GNAT superfamily N-acetyltransferase
VLQSGAARRVIIMGVDEIIERMREKYPQKFAPEEKILKQIHRGNRIFVGTACGEPQYLVSILVEYIENHPKAFFDAEILQVWSLGLAPYADEKFKRNFRTNSFFISDNTRKSVNEGFADYSPIFLSMVPNLFNRRMVPVDVALVQVSPPDNHGYVSLGISVDITKAGVENANLVIAQINRNMPRVHGDTFIHIKDIDFLVVHDEPLLEFRPQAPDDVANKIGEYVSRIVNDGDTIQVGYGNTPNAIMKNLKNKNNLGAHTELLSDGMAELIRNGNIDNSRKSILRGKTVASFCMGVRDTFDYLHDNPAIEFRAIDYVNNPLIIARNQNMTAINSVLQIDLTGQATGDSIGRTFYSGVGGSADFMRGAILAPGGKTILVIQSTAKDGTVSRIVPSLDEGAGVTICRGDVHYVVTEYGIAYLHGKNIRERAMDLIAIAHPDFRPWLIEKAKDLNLIYKDQAFIPGKKGEYPETLETHRKTKGGLDILMRPIKISDEPALKDFFYSLSDNSLYRRFMSSRKDMPHERLQEFVIIDYTKEMVILTTIQNETKESIAGLGQYIIDEMAHTAEVAFVVRDDYQNKGIGRQLLQYLDYLAIRQGLLGLTADVLVENKPMLHLFLDNGFEIENRNGEGTYELKKIFKVAASSTVTT